VRLPSFPASHRRRRNASVSFFVASAQLRARDHNATQSQLHFPISRLLRLCARATRFDAMDCDELTCVKMTQERAEESALHATRT
jgi:hypothetical protein